MKRRQLLVLAALGIMAGLAAVGQQRAAPAKLLVLDWASKAGETAPPVAILIEMGRKDAQAKNWSGQAIVRGAKVVHREGYRFRKGDELVDPDGWKASSHRPLRGPAQMPKGIAIITDGIASVGVVLHLTDVQPDAALTLSCKEQEIDKLKVPLKEVLAGQAQALEGGRLVVRRISTATPVTVARTEDDFPAAAYGPDGRLWVAYISYTVKEENRRIESPPLAQQPKDFKDYYAPEFGDQLFVKYFKGGRWSEAIAVTEPKQDLVRCAIGVEGTGAAWVVYSAQRAGNFNLYARPISANYSPEGKANPEPRPGPEQQLTREEYPQLGPVMTTDQTGALRVAYQSWSGKGQAMLGLFTCQNGKWTPGVQKPIPMPEYLVGGTGTNWHPAMVGGAQGEVALAYDGIVDGDYDVGLRVQYERRVKTTRPASSSKFEARPSLAYDSQGRLWIAYEEGPEQWGKDFGALDDQDGNPMYFARTIRVICLVDDKLMKPVAELPPLVERAASPDTGQKVEALPRYAYPKIGIDGKGRVWLTYRQKFGTRYTTHPGSYWLHMARRLDGARWTEPMEVHHSDGLLDDRPVLLPHPAGGLRLIHNTDGRFTTPETIDNQIYMSYVDLPGETSNPQLVDHESGKKEERLVKRAEKESDAIRRLRDYRIDAGSKKYQLLRGEFHRHTELSWDGGPDGSLEDMFRYGIDAAGMDWIGNGDHDSGAGREYATWLVQKFTDAYHVKNRFTPMFTYERSVSYPHGHRNCVFAKRGIRTLPRLAEPDPDKQVAGIHADDTKMLYRYLRELNGICAVHTSATSMGTDWRDNDPIAEPLVEIYQGDRMSYEIEGAPRAGYDAKVNKLPVNIAGWFPKGFINHALQKGYRLGFQASSDHFSTHISYCVVLAEKHDRAAILDAMRQRHCYGATDNILLDVRSGDRIMGDEFKTAEPPALRIKAVGTDALSRVEILKDSEVVQTFQPDKADFQGQWTDPKPTKGVHYYYVRVLQGDGELAWSSPLWIDYAK